MLNDTRRIYGGRTQAGMVFHHSLAFLSGFFVMSFTTLLLVKERLPFIGLLAVVFFLLLGLLICLVAVIDAIIVYEAVRKSDALEREQDFASWENELI